MLRLFVFVGVGLFLGVFNLLPLNIRGWYTDGMQIWKTIEGQEWDLCRKTLYLGSLHFEGVPVQAWPIDALPSLSELERATIFYQMSGHQLRLQYGLETQDLQMCQTSATWVAENFFRLPNGLRQSIALQMAFFSLLFLRDERLWQLWRSLSQGALYDLRVSVCIFDARAAYTRGDDVQAAELMQQAEMLLDQLPNKRYVLKVQKYLQALREQLEMRGKSVV